MSRSAGPVPGSSKSGNATSAYEARTAKGAQPSAQDASGGVYQIGEVQARSWVVFG